MMVSIMQNENVRLSYQLNELLLLFTVFSRVNNLVNLLYIMCNNCPSIAKENRVFTQEVYYYAYWNC